jgi:hypothetical protein
MNIVLWILQAIVALFSLAGGAYKIVGFEELAKMPATAALSRAAWGVLGVFEIVCGVLLIIPAALKWMPALTPAAAALLVVESLALALLYARHSLQFAATNPLVWVIAIAVMAAFVAYGRYAFRAPI